MPLKKSLDDVLQIERLSAGICLNYSWQRTAFPLDKKAHIGFCAANVACQDKRSVIMIFHVYPFLGEAKPPSYPEAISSLLPRAGFFGPATRLLSL